MSKAVYPGSFNPVHLGHMHVILQASRLFDEVRVLIAVNPEKTYRVSAEDRSPSSSTSWIRCPKHWQTATGTPRR